MPYALPTPDTLYPVTLPDGSRHPGTVFLKPAIDHPRMQVGVYTYASDFDPPDDWAKRLAPYLFPFCKERLVIGKFCQIAHGVRFIGASANHATRGASTFPFPVFDPDTLTGYQPDTRDIVVGHDVWLGNGAIVLAGARIGNGVIVGAGAVVRGSVPDYAVVVGNPAEVHRMRFTPDEIALMTALAWWDWPHAHLEAAHGVIETGKPADLRDYALREGLFKT